MFARILEFDIRPDRMKDFEAFASNEVMPILKKQKGFVDTMTFNKEGASKAIAFTLWDSMNDLENYQTKTFPMLRDKLRPMLNSEPKAEIYSVYMSSCHRISAGKAA